MVIKIGFSVRSAGLLDQPQISNLIQSGSFIHRHLDWRNPLDWLDSTPFLVAENNGRIIAALACPPDLPRVAWIRLFASASDIQVRETWFSLWEAAQIDLITQGIKSVPVIAFGPWYQRLLHSSGFVNRQQIIMLEFVGRALRNLDPPPGILIRSMGLDDLPTVAEVDALAFVPIWQNSLASLSRAYPQAVWATVAESSDGIVGYQISTKTFLGSHLARLAVRPDMQAKGVGSALVYNLVNQLVRDNLDRLTVNTQSDNMSSLALYRKIGFRQTGENYPVLEFHLQ